jgi:hypothetical protein
LPCAVLWLLPHFIFRRPALAEAARVMRWAIGTILPPFFIPPRWRIAKARLFPE